MEIKVNVNTWSMQFIWYWSWILLMKRKSQNNCYIAFIFKLIIQSPTFIMSRKYSIFFLKLLTNSLLNVGDPGSFHNTKLSVTLKHQEEVENGLHTSIAIPWVATRGQCWLVAVKHCFLLAPSPGFIDSLAAQFDQSHTRPLRLQLALIANTCWLRISISGWLCTTKLPNSALSYVENVVLFSQQCLFFFF